MIYEENTFICVILIKIWNSFRISLSIFFAGKGWNANMVAYWTWTNCCFFGCIDCVKLYYVILLVLIILYSLLLHLILMTGLKCTYLYYKRFHAQIHELSKQQQHRNGIIDSLYDICLKFLSYNVMKHFVFFSCMNYCWHIPI